MKKLFSIVLVIFLGYLISYFFDGKAKGYELFPEKFEFQDIGESIENWFEDIGDWFDDLDKPDVSPEDAAMADDYFDEAIELYEQGEYEDAKWKFYDAYSYNPLLFEALYYEGKCNYLTEDYYAATSNFEDLIYETENFDSSFYYLGLSNYNTEYYSDAIYYFEKFLEYNPDSKEAFYEISWCQFYVEDNYSAIENARRSLEIDNNYADGNFSLGYFLINSEEYEEAVSHCVLAFEIGKYAGAAYNSAYCYNKMDMKDSAYFYLSAAIAINNEYALAYSFLSELYYEDNRYYDAIDAANKSINLDGSDGNPYNYRAKSYFELKNYNQALSDFESYYEIDQLSETLYEMGLCNEKLGYKDEAISLYTDYLQYIDDETTRNEILEKIETLQE